MHSALAACSELLIRFGGHAAAAGIEIEEEKLPAFRQNINTWAAHHAARPAPATLQLDAAVGLDELSLENVRDLTRWRPSDGKIPPRCCWYSRLS